MNAPFRRSWKVRIRTLHDAVAAFEAACEDERRRSVSIFLGLGADADEIDAIIADLEARQAEALAQWRADLAPFFDADSNPRRQ